MSLLPVSHTQFQLKSYWDQFFSKRSTPFEWYGQYTDLCHVLHKYVKTTSKTLVVGCGNSKLSEDMYDAGITDITNIDISEVVVKKMGARNFEKRPKMSFTQMDILAMTFDDCVFDCVLDKGTLDAIYSNTDDETVAKVRCMWDEIGRVLKTGGRYVCITLAQQHILNSLLETFSSGWLLRTHKVTLDNGKRDEKREVAGSLPVIVFILTKMASLPAKPAMKVLEVVREDGRCERCEDVEGVRGYVNAAQQHSMLLHHLKSVHPEDPGIRVQYWSEKVPGVPRYTFTVVDIQKSKAKNGLFAIFIVPQGR
jgi:SAM-dependent methyltransferase